MKFLLSLFLLVICISYVFSQEFKIISYLEYDPDNINSRWMHGVRGVASGCDLDEDGKQELFVTHYYHGGGVVGFEMNNNRLQVVFKSDTVGTEDLSTSSPRIIQTGDLDDDGNGEIIFFRGSSQSFRGLYIYEYNGTDNGYDQVYYNRLDDRFSSPVGIHIESFVIDDIDSDDRDELIVAFNGADSEDVFIIYSLSGNFPGDPTLIEEYYLSPKDSLIDRGGGSPINVVSCDMDHDGLREVLCQSWNFGNIFVIEATGPNSYACGNYQHITSQEGEIGLFQAAAADIDGFPGDEVYQTIFQGGDVCRIIDTDGDALNLLPSEINILGDPIAGRWGGAIAHDFNNDGVEEIYFGADSDEGHDLFMWDGNSFIGWTTDESADGFTTKMAIGDLNNNGLVELITGHQDILNTSPHNWIVRINEVVPPDSLALVALYNSTNGANWTNNTNWLSNQDISTWYGVSVENSRVFVLDLDQNNLNGMIPPEIGDLTELGLLSLWGNQLSGSIPSEIGNLSNLQELYLSDNQLSGSIPSTIGNLRLLESLNLPNNQLTGSIPSEIGYLSRLRELVLDANQLTGNIPSTIGNLDSLRFINLSSNNLDGEIPSEIYNLVNLENLLIGYNALGGSLSPQIGNLTNLMDLSLHSNQLSGTIPDQIGNLINLKVLVLAMNSFSGSIPSTIGNLTKLTDLFMRSNQLSGPLPASLGNLTLLYGLSLRHNQLSGEIPDIWANLDNLEFVLLENNNLTGPIPASISEMDNLQMLCLDHNQLTGAVPQQFTNLSKLAEFTIHVNGLDDLPNLSSITTWQEFRADSNHFTFEDLEPNIGINGFVYSPQDSVGVEQDTVIDAGDQITLSLDVGGTNNQYQWFFNNTSTGTNSASLTISDASTANTGSYHCEITNTVVTDLTLVSRPIHLVVSGGPPSIISVSSASDISATAAVLSAVVNPSGLSTTVTFEYGLTNSYGQSAEANPNPISGLENQQVSAMLYPLDPGKTYHFRAMAVNDSGTVRSADQTFTSVTDAELPQITDVTPSNDIALGQDATISCFASDNTFLQSVNLKYRQGGDVQFDSSAMLFNSGAYQGIIPGSFTGIRGVEYYIRATDVAGNRRDSDHQTLAIEFASNTLSVAIPAAPSSDDQNQIQRGYRIISVPAALNERSMSAVLDDDLMGENRKDWRVFKWINGSYQEYTGQTDIALFEPGNAFWIISRSAITIDFPDGVTVETTADYNTDDFSANNWHQIGIPCNYNIAWQDVLELSGAENFANTAWAYEGGSSYQPASILEPYKGYFVKNISASPRSLSFPLHGNTASLARPVVDEDGWEASIRVSAGVAEDNWNLIGVKPSAHQLWDFHDSPEPPPVGSFVSLYFPHLDWQIHPDCYTFDFRAENEAGYVWDMEIQTNVSNQDVHLDFQSLINLFLKGGFDQSFTVVLIDPVLKISQDLLNQSHYSYFSGSKHPTKSFRLILGTEAFIGENNLGVKNIPLCFDLMQNYPNPFNPSTTIYFSIPFRTKISLCVFNILGEKVATIVDNVSYEQGYHFIQWNGQNYQGIPVSSGIYLYQLRAEGVLLTKKMILVR